MKRWLIASRPATLSAAVVPVAVGTACALDAPALDWGAAIAALMGAIFIQIGTNFANDVFDAERGADGEDRLGPTRAVASGLVSPREMRVAMGAAFAIAATFGLYLAITRGWPVIAIGLASIASGIAYTAGPFALAYRGLGDLFVMLFFGFVAVCGTVYVETGAVSALAWAASIPVGALATAILVVNNVRDREGDARANKRTLAVRFGRRAGIFQYRALLAAAYATPAICAAILLRPWLLLPLATLPWAISLARAIAAKSGAELNPTLVSTARLLAVFGVLFAVGIAL
jgi:1,4-dihydroxy-2-naphthoate octaprenyltransferase